jgi:hypothetical protein
MAATNEAPRYSRICCSSSALAIQCRPWHEVVNSNGSLCVIKVLAMLLKDRANSASLPQSGQVTGNRMVGSSMTCDPYSFRKPTKPLSIFYNALLYVLL